MEIGGVRLFVLGVVTVVWAAVVITSIVDPMRASGLIPVTGIMGAIVAYLFASGTRRKKNGDE